jgi:hypothetical protein
VNRALWKKIDNFFFNATLSFRLQEQVEQPTKIRTGGQSQDGEANRLDDPAAHAVPGGPSHQVK